MNSFYIGLGDIGFCIAKELGDNNFYAFDAWSPRGSERLFNINGGKNFPHFLERADAVSAKKWLKIVDHHQMRSNVAELSRAEIRLIYEIETSIKKDNSTVLQRVLSETHDIDTIELIVPMYDNIATSLALLIGWDILNFIKENKLILHLILPDIAFFPITNKTEKEYYYCLATALFKEIEYLHELQLGKETYNISNHFAEKILSAQRKLPFDAISIHSANDLKFEDKVISANFSKVVKVVADSIKENEKTYNCLEHNLITQIKGEYPMFADNGCFIKAYQKYQQNMNSRVNNLLHLDYNFDNYFQATKKGVE